MGSRDAVSSIECDLILKYMIKRNNLYVGGGENNEVSEEFVGLTDNIEPHPEKGGIKLTGYLTYNCLSTNEDASQVII